MNDTWGYKSRDHHFKSARTLVRNLIDIASKGGNYLLNVGPTAAGRIPPESVERLAAIGRWMATNGESIYGTQASPFERPAWGRVTKKRLDGGRTRLYLHVFERPEGGRITIPRVPGRVLGAKVLGSGAVVGTKAEAERISLALPAGELDPFATVVALDLE